MRAGGSGPSSLAFAPKRTSPDTRRNTSSGKVSRPCARRSGLCNVLQDHGFFILSALLGAVPVLAGGSSEETTLSYRDVHKLELNAVVFDVEVRGGGNDLSVRIMDIPQGLNVRDSVRRGIATVDIQARNTRLSRRSGQPRIVVTAPTGLDLDIETASGRISVSDMRGVLQLRTASGGVEISDSRGAFDISTGSGHITIQALELTSVLCGHSAGGSIEVALRNDLRDVRYRLESITGRIAYGDISGTGEITGGTERELLR